MAPADELDSQTSIEDVLPDALIMTKAVSGSQLYDVPNAHIFTASDNAEICESDRSEIHGLAE